MRVSTLTSKFSQLLSITSILSGLVRAQADPYNPSPFTSIGLLDAVHCDDTSDVLAGGSFKSNGATVTVPRNMLIGLPSITISWSELCIPGSPNTPNLPSWGSRSYEISVLANRVDGQLIAGLIYIFPELFQGSDGFINHIDYASGVMRIGGIIGNANTGQKVILNDPVGVYGKEYTAWPLMAADTENPSVKAATGFPMCVPRVNPATGDDPLCPKKNRPMSGGAPRQIFTFGAPPVASGQPDPMLMAPFMVGDFVSYSGAWVSGDTIAAYSMEANLGIFTAPGTQPAFLSVEDARWGIIGNPGGEIGETRVVGYSTDPSTSLEVYAIDVDPCTGVETERTLAVVVPRPNGRLGQWRYRTATNDIGPATREIGVKSQSGTAQTTNGLKGGVFIQPIMDGGFIFPELNVFGAPAFPYDFDVVPFIRDGSGPWQGGIPGATPNPDGPIVGQLDPWPGSPRPPAPNCATRPPPPAPQIPKANAGPAQTVLTAVQVTLTGKSDTVTIPDSDMTFMWEQTSGVTVALTGANTKTATFTSPATFTGTTIALIFKLTVSTASATSTSSVTITVTKPRPETITIVSQSYKNSKGAGILTVRARTTITDGSSVLSMRTVNPNTPSTKMTSLGNGVYELLVNVKPRPAQAVITSNLGASLTIIPN